jgi:Protein of unknown function (DUF2997)
MVAYWCRSIQQESQNIYKPTIDWSIYNPMSMETLEFIIHPDGRVQEKVTGVVGQSCTVVTAAIESALGNVVSQTQTAEYFAANNNIELTATASTQTSW